ncbi:carboxypeptidase regulatory-like domain-containing protein [Halohasta salina]|uniref:carboxypeptidase regulatory-like domain-containing protein n=1 Tax=Halohasta salina TaxID=2961621 RepID=UPI0020A5F23B|nr:carboxypeptidase regulatory-like domain-containing protein [Halohasta salina]
MLVTGSAVASHGAEASGNLTGTVTNEAGDAIEGAAVNITDHGTHLKTTTDSNGEYELTDVPYETQTVEVVHPDYETESTSVAVSTTNSPVTEDFELVRKTGTITGTINSTQSQVGDEIEGVTITVEHDESIDQNLIESGADGLETETTTDSDGSYEIDVPNGSVDLTVSRDGFETADRSVTVDAGKTVTEDIDLDAILTTIEGTVTNENDDAISGADVSVDGTDSSIWGSLSTTTDSDGDYQITDVPGNENGATRTVTADAENFEEGSISVPVDGSTQPNTDNDLSLVQDNENFQLTVTDTNGNQLNNIDVEVEGVDQDQTTTGENGQYSENLPFGTHTVTVSHPDYKSNSLTTEIEQGKSKQEEISIERDTPVDISIDSVTPNSVQSGNEVTVKFSFSEKVYDTVEFSASGPSDGFAPSQTFDTGFDSDYSDEVTFTVPEKGEINDGQYTLSVSALNESASQSVSVSNVFDSEQVEFTEERYQTPAGDFVVIDVSTGDLDEAYLLFGGDREVNEGNLQNYLDVLHIDGDATFVINTRLVGTDVPSEQAYIPVDGEVTSYAHDNGAANAPQGVFSDVSFQDERGNQIAGNLAEFRDHVGLSSRGSPLQAGRYRLVAGGSGTVIERDDNIPDFRQPVGRSNLVLQPPEIRNVTTYTLPPASADRVDQFEDADEPAGVDDIGSLLDSATETDTIAEGDRILIEVQSVGMYGALMKDVAATNPAVTDDGDDPGGIPNDDVDALLRDHEGVHIELADSQLAAPNRPGARLQFAGVDSSDLYVLPDDTADQWNGTDPIGTDPQIGGFYVIVDTRDSEAFDGRPTDGDELTFEIAYESPAGERYEYQEYSLINGEQPKPFSPAVSPDDGVEHFPYFGDSDTTVSANDSFTFEEPYIDYGETTLEDELIVPAEEDGLISGETNIAPGSQAEMQLVASNRPVPKVVTIEDIEISEDRTFEITEDFSDFEPGERVEVEFYSQGRLIDDRLIDKRGVRVVDDLDNPATFEITSFPESVEVERGQNLGDIAATINNTGDIADRQNVNFTVNGETVREQTTVLYSGEETTLDLSEEFVVLSPGEYSYTVSTDDDERTGTLTVTESEDTEVTTTDGNATQSSPPEEDDGDDDSEGSGLLGMVGLRSRDVAVAAAVTGAMHVLGQWT